MKVALVYDRVNKWGGAERVLLALHKIWPDAPLFTAVYDKKRAPWADVFEVHSSFLQKIPFAKTHHELFPWATPMAFESFNFDGYDGVISVTSAEAKDIMTKPGAVHICYCLTPTRYLWSAKEIYERSGFSGYILRMMSKMLKHWDLVAASRPDYYVSISNRVKKRIETYYHRSVSAVIYPPVDVDKFQVKSQKLKVKSEYFLTVSRLVSYKRVDVLIHAFNALGLPLVIIGDGRKKRELKNIAKNTITFVDRHLTDSELVRYYEGCRAFVYVADEDFGIAAAEAQAIGIPVIAYRESGVAEIIKDGVSGILFDTQTPEAVIRAVRMFLTHTFSALECRKQGERYNESRFIKQMKLFVDSHI